MTGLARSDMVHFHGREVLSVKAIVRQLSDTNPKSTPEHRLVTSGFGTITRFRQALDEVVYLCQYLGPVRPENIMTRIL